MANLISLIPYLEKGIMLRGGVFAHDTLTPEQHNETVRVRHDRYLMEGEFADPHYYSLDDLKALNVRTPSPSRSNEPEWYVEDWGVVFVNGGSEYHLTDLQEIDKTIRENTPRFIFGKRSA